MLKPRFKPTYIDINITIMRVSYEFTKASKY